MTPKNKKSCAHRDVHTFRCKQKAKEGEDEAITQLYAEMTDFESLYQAHLKARRGKRDRNEVVEFEMNLGFELQRLRGQLISGRYQPQPYKHFRIYDPKVREIHALQYRDRIVQHSLCDNVIAPTLEPRLIYDNAASRIGKGTHFAMNRLNKFMHDYYTNYGSVGYILKYDIRKYYDSIDHEILYKLMEKLFSDEPEILRLIRVFIDSYEVQPEKGLPLGNQSSQWFALYYLDGLDRLVKEQLRIRYYSRYMDDGILLHHDRDYLRECLRQMTAYVRDERKLEFNNKTAIMPMKQGVDYLGFHFYLTDGGRVVRKLRTSNKKRMKRKLKRFRHAYRTGKMDKAAIDRSLASYMGHFEAVALLIKEQSDAEKQL